MDPHTAAKLDLAQIRGFVDDLLTAHTLCLPDWLKNCEGHMITSDRRHQLSNTVSPQTAPYQTAPHHKPPKNTALTRFQKVPAT